MAFLSAWHLAYAGISVFLVLFGGTMSGLTLGLMSLDLVELEVLQRSGTSQEKKQADAILPVVQKQHELLVTLLLCNAIAMEALPIFLDKLFHPVVAVVLSVTFVLAFGEILPQALCSRYGLAIGANLVWLVRILMILSFPIAYPVGKLLDYLLGHNDAGMFRRAQLKAFVSIHGKEEGKGGELSHDETTIISGALDLTLKIAEEAMTPIESTFSLDVESKLNWETMGKILATGHSRVPVYSGNPRNIIGLLLVKSLLTVRAEAETPVSAVSIRRIPRVPAGMPLYDILNEFQKGQSHMAAVVRRNTDKKHAQMGDRQDAASIMQDSKGGISEDEVQETTRNEVKDVEVQLDIERGKIEAKYIVQVDDTKKNIKEHPNDSTSVSSKALDDLEDGEVIGIITLEDVIEELLQEEIVDETDEYVDVHKRIRVAAAAASATSRSPSIQRVGSSRVVRHASFLQGHKRKPENSSKPERLSSSKADSITQPLLEKK